MPDRASSLKDTSSLKGIVVDCFIWKALVKLSMCLSPQNQGDLAGQINIAKKKTFEVCGDCIQVESVTNEAKAELEIM